MRIGLMVFVLALAVGFTAGLIAKEKPDMQPQFGKSYVGQMTVRELRIRDKEHRPRVSLRMDEDDLVFLFLDSKTEMRVYVGPAAGK